MSGNCPANAGQPHSRHSSLGRSNTGDKLRSSIACAGFVCFIPLFGRVAILPTMCCCLALLSNASRHDDAGYVQHRARVHDKVEQNNGVVISQIS